MSFKRAGQIYLTQGAAFVLLWWEQQTRDVLKLLSSSYKNNCIFFFGNKCDSEVGTKKIINNLNHRLCSHLNQVGLWCSKQTQNEVN